MGIEKFVLQKRPISMAPLCTILPGGHEEPVQTVVNEDGTLSYLHTFTFGSLPPYEERVRVFRAAFDVTDEQILALLGEPTAVEAVVESNNTNTL